MKKAFWFVLNISLLLLLLAFCMFVADVGRKLVATILSSQLVIAPENESVYNSWVKPPVGSVYNYYLWNIDNPEEILNGAKPKLSQKGPFCHESRNHKENITHSDGTIKFKVKTFYYERDYPGLNCQPMDMNITTFNVPYGMLMAMLETPAYVGYKGLVKMMLPKDWNLIMHHTAREIIWGYDEPVFQKLNSFANAGLPNQYGHALGNNGSYTKEYEIDDGSKNIRDVSAVKSWMNMTELNPIWRSDRANQILGTDGNSMPPLLEKDKEVYIFVDQMCRSLVLKPIPEPVKLGQMEIWKYVLTAEALKNGDEDPNNAGFCIGERGSCAPSGTLDLSTCLKQTMGFEVPMILSKPHFLHGDPKLRSLFDGIEPNEDKHQTALYAEPTTGLILKAAKRLQLNYRFISEATADVSALKDGGIVPLYYIEQTFEANSGLLAYVRKEVVTPLLVVEAAPLLVVLLGLIGCCFSLAMGVAIHLREKRKVIKEHNAANDKLLATKS